MEKGQKFKGTATLWSDGRVDFRPQAAGDPRQRGIAETRDGKLYETTGQKPQVVAHLKCDARTVDRAAALHQALEELLPPEERRLKPPRGRLLLQDADLEVRLNQQTRHVEVRIDMDTTRVLDIDNHIFKLLTRINTCLAFNRTLLRPQSRA